MKIVCLIQDSAPLVYFANRINAEHPLTEVIVEKRSKASRSFLVLLRQHGVRKTFEIILRKLAGAHNRDDYSRFFGADWRTLDKGLCVAETDSINSDDVHNRMMRTRPDIILCHGTSIVKDNILSSAQLSLNLHWGLSPYYRGTHCTDWALINWDPYNIGVTIHKLAAEIDGGGVLAQQRAVVMQQDTSNSINMQLTRIGTELMIKALAKIKRGEPLGFIEQDLSHGYLTYRRQWTPFLQKQLMYIEKNRMIEKMLKHPSRSRKLPIVNTLDNV